MPNFTSWPLGWAKSPLPLKKYPFFRDNGYERGMRFGRGGGGGGGMLSIADVLPHYGCAINIQCASDISRSFLSKQLRKGTHSSRVRAKYGSFVSSKCHQIFKIVLYVIICYILPRYIESLLYCARDTVVGDESTIVFGWSVFGARSSAVILLA